MSIAIKEGINLGSTSEEIKAIFGVPYKKELENNSKDFYLEYRPDNTKSIYKFTGIDNGLFSISVQYFR